MHSSKIHVLIVSQQVLFRQGIEHTLSTMEDIEITGAADYNNGVSFAVDDFPPDVAIVDIDAPYSTGLELAYRIKQRLPSIGIVVLTSNPNDAKLFQALKCQTAAYLSKEVTHEQLVYTIKRVANGEHPINESLTSRPDVANRVLHQFQGLAWRGETENLISPTTPRETEILDYIAQGYLNKQIAKKLGISEQTIKNHVTSILRKLNANARTEAVVIGIKQGLISVN